MTADGSTAARVWQVICGPRFNMLDPVVLTIRTIVEFFAPDVYLVEFCDEDGETIALPDLRSAQMRPMRAADSR